MKKIICANSITCEICSCIFSYGSSDVIEKQTVRHKHYVDTERIIRCPQCGHDIHLGHFRKFYSDKDRRLWREEEDKYYGNWRPDKLY